MGDLRQLTKEEQERAIALLQREKDNKAKEKARMADPAYKAKVKEAGQRASAKNALMLGKAVAAGITVTKEEIDHYLAEKAKK
jgi:histidinol dehydrogenase